MKQRLVIACIVGILLSSCRPACFYVVVEGRVIDASTVRTSMVKGGYVVSAKVNYEFTYLGTVYTLNRLTCDSSNTLSAHSSKADDVSAIEAKVADLVLHKKVNVFVRRDAPSLSCLVSPAELSVCS